MPSLLRSQARGDESVGIESVKDCQFCPRTSVDAKKANKRSIDLNMVFNLNKVNLGNYHLKPLFLQPHSGEIGSVAQLYSALDFGSSGWGLESLRGHKRKTQHESAGFFVFKAFKIHFDKRLKSKKTKIAQQFWVCACDEQILGNTRQRNPFLVQNLF